MYVFIYLFLHFYLCSFFYSISVFNLGVMLEPRGTNNFTRFLQSADPKTKMILYKPT